MKAKNGGKTKCLKVSLLCPIYVPFRVNKGTFAGEQDNIAGNRINTAKTALFPVRRAEIKAVSFWAC
jgi:hypothetical protein